MKQKCKLVIRFFFESLQELNEFAKCASSLSLSFLLSFSLRDYQFFYAKAHFKAHSFMFIQGLRSPWNSSHNNMKL